MSQDTASGGCPGGKRSKSVSRSGINYFSFDTDFFHTDKKIRLIKSEFGSKGVVILIHTLCAIYSDKGYYKSWGEDDCYLASEDLGCDCSPALIGEVINRCVKRGIFDETVFNASGVLTSHGIQIRFLRAAAKREKIEIIKEYALFDLNELTKGMRKKVTFFSEKGDSLGQKGDSSGQKVASKPIKKEIKERKDINNVHPERMHGTDPSADQVEELFESVWKLYPIKKGKGQVSASKKKTLYKIGFDQIKRCVDRYLLDMKTIGRDQKYWMNGSTFFNSGYVDYLDKNYEPDKRTAASSTQKSNKFNNFDQRQYDYDRLEQMLLTTRPDGDPGDGH